MTIRDLDAFVNSVVDWNVLDGCFHGKIAPTDIDGLVERNGRFLLLEGKKPGVLVPMGQQIMFNALLRTKLFTIVCFWGTPISTVNWEQSSPAIGLDVVEIGVWVKPTRDWTSKSGDLVKLREICSKWSQMVEDK